ncbi:MAG TPA: hypothetical protein VNN79_22305 [Actinomycetota bacterium]|nr:hypothetical protein [Actinomycetota bacterium]
MLPNFRNPRSAPGSRLPIGVRFACAATLVLATTTACSAATPPPPDLQASATSGGLIAGGGLVRPTAFPSGQLPPCQFPARLDTPDWMPDDLPFPPGSYVTQELGLDGGFHKALMVVPTDLTTYTKFVLEQWPKAGYQLGRGDSELYEVEDIFTKAPAVGAFKAVSQACSPGYSKMLFIYADQSPGLPVLPSPRGTALNAGGSPGTA